MKISRSAAAAIPRPVSLTARTAASPWICSESVISPRAGVNLAALSSRLETSCESRAKSPMTGTGSGGMAGDGAEVDARRLQRHPAGADARHIQQIVDEPRELLALAVEHVDDVLRRRARLRLERAQEMHAGADRGERVSQLVG